MTNIVPGVGGAGGGIFTYSKNLISGLDKLIEENKTEIEILVVGHPEFLDLLNLTRIKAFSQVVNNQSFLARIYWLNVGLPRFLKKNQVDVIHRVIPELPFLSSIASIFTLHDFMFDFYLSHEKFKAYLGLKEKVKFWILRFIMRAALRGENLILVPSQSIADELKSRFPSKDLNVCVTKLATIHKGKTPEKTVSRQANEGIKIGFIAGFYPHKGHKKAIELMKSITKTESGKSVKLFFRGSRVYPAYFEEIKALVEKENLGKSIFFEKFKKDISMEDIYHSYDVTLLFSEYEGFGLPGLESQMFNKPVLCSDLSVFRENLSDSAFYIHDNIDNREVERIMRLLNDEVALKSLAKKGKKNSSQYSWENTSQQTLTSYLSLV